MSETPEFWEASGYRLLARGEDGWLRVTDDFLRAYYLRSEMRPPVEACQAERALHAQLLEKPEAAISEPEIAALADPDARDNYRVLLQFRDLLLQRQTLEAAYLQLARAGTGLLPPLFLDHLVHAILRGLLEGAASAQECRAGELLFRTQRISLQDGQIMAADAETVDVQAASPADPTRLVDLLDHSEGAAPVTLDVLDHEKADSYWRRSDSYDTVLDLTFARPGLDALCRVMEKWLDHLLGLLVSIQPVQAISDEQWRWHCGLDSESTAILNDLYRGEAVDEARLGQLISLFRMEIEDRTAVLPEMAGRPVYLGLAMSASGILRLKPQNLLVNLPLAPRL